MENRVEGMIRKVYRQWKGEPDVAHESHPDEEALSCLLEGRLPEEESARIKMHIIHCRPCAQSLALNIAASNAQKQQVPEELMHSARCIFGLQEKRAALEIVLRLKDDFLELINTTGVVLVGQELVPAPLLRSRSIKDFKRDLTILKDFKQGIVEIKIENKGAGLFDLLVRVRQHKPAKGKNKLRATLFKADLELESYMIKSDEVKFEHLIPGKYKLIISGLAERFASVILDISN